MKMEKINCRRSRCGEEIRRYFRCVNYACLLDFPAKMTSSSLSESQIQKRSEDRYNVDRVCHDKDVDHG